MLVYWCFPNPVKLDACESYSRLWGCSINPVHQHEIQMILGPDPTTACIPVLYRTSHPVQCLEIEEAWLLVWFRFPSQFRILKGGLVDFCLKLKCFFFNLFFHLMLILLSIHNCPTIRRSNPLHSFHFLPHIFLHFSFLLLPPGKYFWQLHQWEETGAQKWMLLSKVQYNKRQKCRVAIF